MTTFEDLKDCHCVVDSSSGKFLCFTRLSRDILVLCASDGCDLWKLELDPGELEAHRELADIQMDPYLSKLKNGLQSGDITVTQSGVKCTLTVGYGTKALIYELYEAKVVEKKSELQSILFSLATRTSELETQLSKANKKIDSLRQQKVGGAAGGGGMFDLGDGKKGKNQPNTAAKKVGMSVVNPGSKKRKAAKGVEFD